MKHRGLARLAVAAGAVLAGAVMAANPAAATDSEIGSATLKLSTVPTEAKNFGTKSCEGIPGGAKAGTDGWVFSQPVTGTQGYGYIFGLIDGDQRVVVLGVDKDGVTGLKVKGATLQGLKAGKLSGGEAKSLAKTAEGNTSPEESTSPEGDTSSDDVEEIAAPEGVAGGVTATGEGWVQTPAGWQLASGALLYAPAVENAPKEFSLLRVCVKADVAPPAAPGAGGGNGQSLPVTGTNVAVLTSAGVLLIGVGVGAVLFVMRRRRETTKFVA